MSKKRTKKYLKKLDKAMQENNRYLAGIMDLLQWEKMEKKRKDSFWVETVPMKESTGLCMGPFLNEENE